MNEKTEAIEREAFVEAGLEPEDEPQVKLPLKLEDWLSALVMAVLCLITFANVVLRYFIDASFAWTEEISIFLMMVLALLAGSAATARDRQIRIEYFAASGSLERRKGLALFSAACIFIMFLAIAILGAPIGVALGLGGMAAIALSNLDTQMFGLLAIPQNFYAGLAKYPLLAIPMFVLVDSIFDCSGVANRLVNFAIDIVGRGPGMLPLVAILVAMFLGGISGSGPANAAAVGSVMIAAMSRAGYPPAFSASVVGAAASTNILIPPSVTFVIYSVLVPGASVPTLFAAGMIPGVLAGLALIIPAVWLARKHKMGAAEADLPRPPFVILGGMRAG